MSNLISSLPKLVFILALLGVVAYLTVDGVMSGNDAIGFLSLIIGATAVAGTIVLSGPTPNTDLYPHVILLVAIIGFTAAMGAKGIFDGTEIVSIFGVLIGGGSVAIGSVNPTTTPVINVVVDPPAPGVAPAEVPSLSVQQPPK